MVIESRFYDDIADHLASGAVAALEAGQASYERFDVPGALEVPALIAMALRSNEAAGARRYDGYVALGCVIRGETSHYDIVCNESARGLQDLATRHGLAVGNGILTCENRDQALERARPDRLDKGGVAAKACLRMIALRAKLEDR